MEGPKHDYLKYWRVVKFYAQKKYKISTGELEMMLFLYSEKYFTRAKFKEFDELLSWDENRFEDLVNRKWIKSFRKGTGKYRAIYELSYKGKRMVINIYKKLNGEEFPENWRTPMFLKGASYSEKVYRNMIKQMNKEIREQRQRPSQK